MIFYMLEDVDTTTEGEKEHTSYTRSCKKNELLRRSSKRTLRFMLVERRPSVLQPSRTVRQEMTSESESPSRHSNLEDVAAARIT